jgi:uncharacterized protein YdeI (YjbR/CyaY-like superfamily)
MPSKDKRVDEYIKNAQPFAQPVLTHFRKLIHKACPNVVETIKWGMPFFDYKGPYCSMAAFKNHAVFAFWKAKLLTDKKGYLAKRSNEGGESMGHLGRITSVNQLPPDSVIIDFLKQAKDLNEKGIKLPVKPKNTSKTELIIPEYFLVALNKSKKAKSVFESFSPSHKKEYVEWITEAKTEETRNKRLKTALDWIAEGKIRNWKYIK